MTRDADRERFMAVNREWWDAIVPVHEASRGYDREGFLRGEKSVCEVERDELGPLVPGKTLLHLQCHFGMDTLSWARLGARVTGLDFSEPAIAAARRLARDSGVPGRFVHASVYDAPEALGEHFDIVYTGIGALNWLPDVARWARVVAACLKSGGVFYLYEGHPMLWTLDAAREDGQLVVTAPYFEVEAPLIGEYDTTYVDSPKLPLRRICEWNHGLGEIVTALIQAGLRIRFVHEHRDVPWKALPWMERPGSDGVTGEGYVMRGRWQLPEAQRDRVPLMYSLLAIHE